MKINAIIRIGILFMIFPSCQKNDRQLITQPQKQTVELRQIPVEEALATLTEFLQENKGDLRDTRSGRPREWEGLSNGYFSTSCLNPAEAEEYDNPSKKSSSSYAYSWHFRLITYDVPSEPCTGTIDYMY